MRMKRTPSYYDGYAASNPIGDPTVGTVYAADPIGAYSGYKLSQHAPYGLGNDAASPPKRKADQSVYPEQGMRLGTPATDDADGHYEYDMSTYSASRSRNEGGLSAGDYGDSADLDTIRVQNRSGRDVRMVISNHSNMTVSLDQSAGSSVSSADNAPPTPRGDTNGYGFSMSSMHGRADSPMDGPKAAGSTNSNSNAASSPTDSSRKKQKRNKPTLSCSECVERKTKVGGPCSECRTSTSHRLTGS